MQLTKSTKSLKASEVQADWYLIDATNVTLGRLAAYTATLLRGKKQADIYAPYGLWRSCHYYQC